MDKKHVVIQEIPDTVEMEKEENKTVFIKPPLGIKPKWAHDEDRAIEIFEAMARYSEAKLPIPKEWIKELLDIFTEHFHNKYGGDL